MDTEQAPFTRELFLLLGLINPPKVHNAVLVNPLTPWSDGEKIPQAHKDRQHPGCIFQTESGKWAFRVAWRGIRLRKGGFPDAETAKEDMLRWLNAQKALRSVE